VDHGADLKEGSPVYQALVGNPLGVAGLVKEWRASRPEVQDQLDQALFYHTAEGSGKVIGYLLWAGAQAHVRTPNPEDPEDSNETAIEAAVRRGDVSILKQMHPGRHPGLIPGLTANIRNHDIRMLEYLLSIGAPINDKANGGSSLIDQALWSLAFLCWAARRNYRNG
jgi:hypothetical protein